MENIQTPELEETKARFKDHDAGKKAKKFPKCRVYKNKKKVILLLNIYACTFMEYLAFPTTPKNIIGNLIMALEESDQSEIEKLNIPVQWRNNISTPVKKKLIKLLKKVMESRETVGIENIQSEIIKIINSDKETPLNYVTSIIENFINDQHTVLEKGIREKVGQAISTLKDPGNDVVEKMHDLISRALNIRVQRHTEDNWGKKVKHFNPLTPFTAERIEIYEKKPSKIAVLYGVSAGPTKEEEEDPTILRAPTELVGKPKLAQEPKNQLGSKDKKLIDETINTYGEILEKLDKNHADPAEDVIEIIKSKLKSLPINSPGIKTKINEITEMCQAITNKLKEEQSQKKQIFVPQREEPKVPIQKKTEYIKKKQEVLPEENMINPGEIVVEEPREAKKNLRKCAKCGDEFPIENLISLSCEHYECKPCLSRY